MNILLKFKLKTYITFNLSFVSKGILDEGSLSCYQEKYLFETVQDQI